MSRSHLGWSLAAATVVGLLTVTGTQVATAAPDRPSVVSGAEFDAYVAAAQDRDKAQDRKIADLAERVAALEADPAPEPEPTTPPTTEPPTPTPTPVPEPEPPTPAPEPEPTPVGDSALPYGPDSYFQSRADSLPVDATRTAEFQKFMAAHPDQGGKGITWPKVNMNASWAMSYDYGTAADPIWHLKGGNTGDARLAVVAVGGKGFHMSDATAATFPSGSQDRPGVIIDEASGFTVQFADAVPDLATRTITVSNAGILWHSSNGLDYRNPLSDDQRNFTSRGRILDAMIVTREDLDRAVAAKTGVGHVLHLYFVETNSAAGFKNPMVGAESGKNGWGAEGDRIRLKPSIDLEARGLTGYPLALARTMQQNGLYVGDQSGSATQVKLSQAEHYQGTGLTTDVFKGKLDWRTDFEVVKP